MTQIKPYILTRSKANGFDFYKYLHIRGGSGSWFKDHKGGGVFDFILFYAMPEEMDGKDPRMCERLWCIEKGIVFGEGATIEAAYEDYKQKTVTINQTT